jgi:hypothetical protein
LETARFSKILFFSLFSLILLSINSNKNKHLRRPPRFFDVPEYKNHGTKAGTRITQTLDFIRLFLFQTFRLSGTTGTKPRPALEQNAPRQISTALFTPNPAKPHPATPHLAAPDTCQKRIASRDSVSISKDMFIIGAPDENQPEQPDNEKPRKTD